MEPTVIITAISFAVVTLISSLSSAASSTKSWTETIVLVSGVFGAVVVAGSLWGLSTFWNSAEQKLFIIPKLFWLGVWCFAIGGAAGALTVLIAKMLIGFVRR